MKYIIKTRIVILLLLGLLQVQAVVAQKKKEIKKPDPMLCQGNYWTEEQGRRFLAKQLGLDLSKAMYTDGSLNEDEIVTEAQEALYPFDNAHPFPTNGIRKNDLVVWK